MCCRECKLCDTQNEKCSLTGRPIKLDSLRNCKKGIRKVLVEASETSGSEH